MKRNDRANQRQQAGKARRLVLLTGAAGTALVLGGCNVDSYMDPSVTGRWEDTPTKTPIIDRFTAYEGPANEGIETSKVRAEDLIPEVEAYRVGPGDGLELTVEDFFRDGVPLRIDNLEVDPRGFVDLPQVGAVFVYGQTTDQMVASVRKSLAQAGVLNNAIVNVIVRSRRKLTYGILGAVDSPGFYSITKPDFRLMDALSQAGRFDQQLEKVIVIRRIPLSDRVTGRPTGAGDMPAMPPSGPGGMKPSTNDQNAPSGGKKPAAVDIIDELSKPGTNAPAPSMFSSTRQPATAPASSTGSERKPMIDLVEPAGKPATMESGGNTASTGGNTSSASQWVFVNGQWVQQAGAATSGSAGPTAAGAGPGLTPIGATANAEENPASELMTQRVIEIPLAPLLAGSAQYNIVIRPGDTIRIPTRGDGVFYVAGQVARPGPYNLPTNGKMTIMRAIDSAGGFGSAAIPERVDLTRMVGPDRQVTIKVNYRAISEGTHPDIAIKPDDRINVGSNFFAFPLAVVRNGLRASYGFGFILDRNFGYDVFGPQQTNEANQ